jgi:DUF971 family protein
MFEISWADGTTSRIAHQVLRGYCPCADCQGHGGDIRYVKGGNLELVDISRVGNYALGLKWADGHSVGIYTFDYLRQLGDLTDQHGPDALCELGQLPPQ